MSLSDDELIIATPYDSGTKHETFREGNTKLTTIHKEETWLEESKLTIFLELTGAGHINERSGVDIVAVLDVSNTMTGPKLNTLKAIFHVLIDKLSTTDRLSIVTFSNHSKRLCSLSQISIASRFEIGKLVDGLGAGIKDGKDIKGGLDMAFQVINNRKYTTGRPSAILFLSDGVQIQAPNNSLFEMVPVYTFGVGEDQNSMVLRDIAQKSAGGIFTTVDVNIVPGNLLSIALSQCLANLLTVVVTDLKLTIKRVNSKTEINKVCLGTYSLLPFTVSEDDVIVSLGDVYANETCKVQVDLLLPSVTSKRCSDVLQIFYSCRKQGKLFKSTPRLISITRVVYPANQQVEASKFQGLTNLIGKDLIGVVVEGATEKFKRFFNRPKLDTIESSTKPEELDSNQDSSTDPMETMTDHLTEALESVEMIREILGDYLTQQIEFEGELNESIDPIRANNIIALGEHIKQVFDSIKTIEEILMQAETTDDSSMANENEQDLSLSINDHVTEAFESVEMVREILIGYVDNHSQFEVGLSESSDPSRSEKVKELGEHNHRAFDSVKAIEEILQSA